jgi:uncharacterized membrane protein
MLVVLKYSLRSSPGRKGNITKFTKRVASILTQISIISRHYLVKDPYVNRNVMCTYYAYYMVIPLFVLVVITLQAVYIGKVTCAHLCTT